MATPSAPPAAPPSPPPAVPPSQPYYWPAPPPPKNDSRLVILIIVVVLVIVIVPIVLAAVLYVMVGGLVEGPGPGPGETRPSIVFGQGRPITEGFEFAVAGVSLQRPGSSYRVNLLVNGTASTTGPRTLAPSIVFSAEGQTYAIGWMDIGGEGDLTGGDIIKVTRTGGISSLTDFTVAFLWIDGSMVGSRTYP